MVVEEELLLVLADVHAVLVDDAIAKRSDQLPTHDGQSKGGDTITAEDIVTG